MQFWLAFAAVLALLFGGLRAFGQEQSTTDKPAAKACCQAHGATKDAAAKDGCKEGAVKEVVAKDGAKDAPGCCAAMAAAKAKSCCSTDKAIAAIPAMTYRIGDKDTCCSEMADKLAKENNTAIKYVVDGKAFDKKDEALVAYADVLETHFAKVTNIQYAVGDDCGSCPVTAAKLAKEKGTQVKYQLAAYRFSEEKAAQKAVEDAKAAAEKVTMKMVVGSEQFECPMSAQDAATKAGKPIEYAIGECRTPCKVTARVELAKARITAALKAIASDAGENTGA